MKAWQIDSWCDPDGMRYADLPIPEPPPGTVRIRHHAAGVNFYDTLQIQGKYQVKPPLPFTPGGEAAGVVDALGKGVTSLTPGERVTAILFGGAFAEYSVAPAVQVFPIPDTMSYAEAAAMPIAYHTSLYALERRAPPSPGEWLLVHAGASGVGMSAIQIGKALGARVIATAGSPLKRDFCLSIGADFALDYRDASWVDQVKAITGRGADLIYDPVGGDIFDLSTKCIAPEGRLMVIGFASGRIPSPAANRILLKDISIVGVYWGGHMERHPDLLRPAHDRLMAMFEKGSVRPRVSGKYPLDEAPTALKAIANREVVGKIVLEPR